jgi:hypothetical protein
VARSFFIAFAVSASAPGGTDLRSLSIALQGRDANVRSGTSLALVHLPVALLILPFAQQHSARGCVIGIGLTSANVKDRRNTG